MNLYSSFDSSMIKPGTQLLELTILRNIYVLIREKYMLFPCKLKVTSRILPSRNCNMLSIQDWEFFFVRPCKCSVYKYL